MKDRIRKIMESKGMNQKEFSQATEINQATLSGIFNGRTSPTLNHAQQLYRHFPNISLRWIMFGDGEMYEKQDEVDGSASSDSSNPTSAPLLNTSPAEPTFFDEPLTGASAGQVRPAGQRMQNDNIGGNSSPSSYLAALQQRQEVVKYIDKPQRRITEIRIFFDDGTYEVFPGK